MKDIDLTPLRERLRWRVVDPALIIPGTSLTLASAEAKVQEAIDAAGPARDRAQYFESPVRPYRGLTFLVLALAIFCGAIVVQFSPYVPLPKSSIGAVSVGLLMFGSIVAARSWACFRPKAESIVASDGRAPIVYLRSFRDDAAHIAIGDRPYAFWSGITMLSWKYLKSLRTSPLQNGVRLEQAAAKVLGRLGPFVAIGEPHEAYPDFGATRAYFEGGDEAWKEKVAEWIARSSIIVLVPGTTPGLAWELGQALQPRLASKLLMIFPADRAKARKARLATASGMCPDIRWKAALVAPTRSELVAMFSSSDGEIVRITCASPEQAEFKIAMDLAVISILGRQPPGVERV